MKKYLLGIDAGSSSVKSVLFDTKGNALASASEQNRRVEVTEESRRLGFEEVDADGIWDSTKNCIHEVIRKSGIDASEIAAVGICSFGNGVLIVDENGRPNAKGALSQDYRAAKILETYRQEGSLDKINHIIAGTLFAGEPGPILRWYKENRPDIYSHIGSILLCKDYLIYKLTGELSADINCFGGSALLDLSTFQYSRELMNLYGIPEMYDKLPKLRESASIAGTVTEKAAGYTGLSVGTPVAAGMMDILACLVGAGAADEGVVTIVAGTWCINETQSTKIIPGASANQPSLGKGLYLNCSYTGASAINFDWFGKALGGTAQMEAVKRSVSHYDILDEMIGQMSPDQTEVLFHPFVAQPSVHPNAKANFFNIDQNTSYREVVYAVAEGIVFLHKWHIDFLRNTGCKITSARLTGGIAKSPVWAQLFADILQIPVEVVDCDEVGALGAAITAGVGAKTYQDYQDGFRQAVRIRARFNSSSRYLPDFEVRYREWEHLMRCLKPYWDAK
ncbi:FGGY-family carbohydrate kinase [Clostridium sp. KNHs216]|uniref:FGGY-family carbohydrate kinase n=1 Tax=Clostridium sp. KNHs216 TaxID=1550235 RepID=UPI00114EB1C1|nr:FGGY-family carbohydrate kinase [Clostridium sp. KNHs216]TQI68329.1 L-xylulokinase [Clostridium sp. KNHs216]